MDGRFGIRPQTMTWPALLLAATLALVACGEGRGGARLAATDATAAPASERATETPAPTPRAAEVAPSPAPAAANAAPASPTVSPGEAAQVIAQAYRELTARLFREVKPSDLLAAGWRGVRDDAKRQGFSSTDQIQPFIEAGSGDIDAFAREFALFLSGPGLGLDASKLSQAAIRGITSSIGDSHTRYLTPQQAEVQNREGAYSGIGVVTRQDGSPGLLVGEVYTGGPAERAGVRAGDRIVRVNGADISGQQQSEISNQIRGETGTAVILTLLGVDGAQRDVSINRARIAPPVVTARLQEDGIGYLRVAQFPRRSATVDAAADFEAALIRLQAEGARAFVLDLRGNPGGDPTTSVDIASNFVQDGPIFVSVNRSNRKTTYAANKSRKLITSPLVVLIDGASASGAEVVASALSEYGVGYLIGTRSCGCLSVGQPLRLDDKSEIVVTVQQALTGRYERSLEGVGLDPDETVRASRVLGTDLVLERAVEVLRVKLK